MFRDLDLYNKFSISAKSKTVKFSALVSKYWDFESSNERQGPKFCANVLQIVSFFHHSKKQQPPAFLFLKLFQNLTYSNAHFQLDMEGFGLWFPFEN